MAGEYTLLTGDTESWGKQGSYFYGSLRVHYEVVYYPESNQSYVIMTPQFWANANIGNDNRFFNGSGSSSAGIYGNGNKLYEFSSNYGSGNYMACGNADNTWTSLSGSVGMVIQHDSSGNSSFTTAVYCTVIALGYPISKWEYATLRDFGNTTSNPISVHANAPFSITYNMNGGSGSIASQGVYVGVSYTLSSTTPTRSGYTFLGWSTSNTATTASYTGGQSVTPNGNLALYAVWKKATYTVSYNANGGTGAPAAQTKTHDVALTLSSTRPTKASASAGSFTVTYNAGGGSVSPATATCNRTTNYNFSKWNTAANGSGTNYNAGASYTANANATLYAQYTATTVTASTTLPTPVKSGFSFNGWYTAASGGTKVDNGGASYTPTATITLYAQWTALASTISACPSSAATNSSVTLTVNRASTAYHHKVTFKKGSTTLAAPSAVFATSLTYTIPRSWFNGYPNATSLSVTVSVQTYTDSTATIMVGSAATTTMTVTADAAIKPTVTSGWASAAYYNTGTAAAAISGYVKGYSKARVTFDSSKITMANNATISSYSIACQGTTDSSSPYETPVLTSTSVPIVCTVTDSRGRTASQTLTVSVMDYSAPSITGVSAFRCDASMTADDDGTYLCVKASKAFSSLNNQNACTLKVAYAAAGGSYGSATDLVNNTATRLGTVSPDISYTLKFTAKDSLNNEATYFATIPTRKWAMKFRSTGNGVAFGKAAETDNVFEVTPDWTVKLGTPLPVTSGGTGANTAAGARTNLGAVSKAGDTMTGALTVSSGNITAPAGSIIAGTDGNTAAERQISCRSGAGTLFLYSQASATGSRGLWVPAHGTGEAKAAISIDTNNNCSFNGTATKADKDKDGKDLVKGYVQVYNSPDLGGQTATFSVNDLAASGNGVAMVNSATDNPQGQAAWTHVLNLAWQKGVNTSYISQLAFGVHSAAGLWYRTTNASTIVGKAWKRLFDNSMTIPIENGGTGGTSLATARANLQMPRYPYYYYGSDSENANGWYKMCTVSQSSWSDCNLNLLFTSGYSRVAVGLLNVRVRCNNTTANALQGFHWMFRKGFAPGDVYFKDNGNNTWCLYVRQTVQRYGRIQVQILTQTGTTSRIDYAQYFADNATKESAAPTGGAASADGVVLLAKTASGLTSADSTASIRKTLSLGTTDISAYRMIQITVYSSVAGVEKQCSQVIFPSYYDGGRISLGWYSDVNTTYYMCTDVTLVGSSFNIYRAWYSNYSAPSFKVVGIY